MQKKTAILQNTIKKTLKTSDKKEEFVFELITGKERVRNALYKWGESARTMDIVLKFDPLTYYIRDELETQKIKRRKDLKMRVVTDAHPKMICGGSVDQGC